MRLRACTTIGVLLALSAVTASASEPPDGSGRAEALSCTEARRLLQQESPLEAGRRSRLERLCAGEPATSGQETRAALDQWQQDWKLATARHARALAASSDPRDLLAAALIVSIGRNPPPALAELWTREDAGDAFTTAIQRGQHDPLINWMEAIDCRRFAAYATCDADEALSRLQRIEADNAAVWLLAYTRVDKGSPEADRFLETASRATRYRLPFNDLGALMHQQFAAIDVPDMSPPVARAFAETLGYQGERVPDLAGIEAMSIASALTVPALSRLQLACFPPGGVEPTAERRAACIAIYTLMSQDPLSISQGLALVSLVRLTADAPEGAGWRERLRQLHWIQSNAVPIMASSAPEGYIASVWRDGELVAMRGLLAAAGIPLEPPAGWLPDDPRIRAYIEGS